MRIRSTCTAVAASALALLAVQGIAQEQRPAVAPAFSAKDLTARPDDRLDHERRQRLQPALFAADAQSTATTSRTLKGVWRTQPERLGHGRASTRAKRSRSSTTASSTSSTGANDVFALDVDTRRDPLDVRGEPRSRTSRSSAAAGRAAASRSATARSSSASSTASSSRSISDGQGRRGRSRPSAGRTASRITSAPLYYDGLVITGFAGGEPAIRGRVKAFDARDGKLVWTFYTIPGPGELGHDTWPQDNDVVAARRRAGLADAGRRSRARAHLLLDGQPRPRLQRRRARRRQPVLRLDRRGRGEDRASTAGTSSRCITTSGTTTRRIPSCCSTPSTTARMRKGLAQVGKTGWVYILDRDDGQAAHRHRRAARAAGAAPGDGRDAAVSRAATRSCRRDRHRARRLRRSSTTARSSRRSGTSPCVVKPRHAAARTGRRARTIPRRISSMSARPTAPRRTRRRKAAPSG